MGKLRACTEFFVFVNWFKNMEFYTGFLLCYICIMCRYDIFFTTFSILIQCGVPLCHSSFLILYHIPAHKLLTSLTVFFPSVKCIHL